MTELESRNAFSRALFGLFLLTLVAAFAIGTQFAKLAGPANGPLHAIFVWTATLGQIAALISLFVGGVLLLARTPLARRVLAVAGPAVLGLFLFFLLLDAGVYTRFKFHFNGLVWQIVTTPTVRDALEIPTSDLVFIFGLGLLIVLAQVGAFWWLRRATAAAGWRPRWRVAFGVVAGVFLLQTAIFAWSDLRGAREIVRSARAVPLYQRVTVRNVAQKLGVVPERQALVKVRQIRPEASTLKYPLTPLEFEQPASTPNVVWIALEGWRWDMFSEETTPRLWAWAQNEQIFERHHSGGNRTATGVFSMFYGLNGNYWDTMLSERKQALLMTRVQELGYRVTAMAAREIGFIDVRNSVFAGMPEVHIDQWPMERQSERDAYMAELAKKFIQTPEPGKEGKPFFAWMLFDSSHVPYDFPEGFGKFEPYARAVSYREIGISEQRAIESRNRYRNALLYEDHVVGEFLDWMKKEGLMENTVVLITGDHGEEFYENGYWTHGGGCTPQVVRVPLLAHVPGKAPARHSYVTSHHDFAPTLLEMLGVKNPPTDYSVGRPLFGEERVPYIVSCGWSQSALVDDSGWVIFANDFQNPWDYEVRDPDYREVVDQRAAAERRTLQVASAVKNMNAFLK